MNVVLSGEIEGYRRIDADIVSFENLRVKPNAVLHLTSPRVAMHVLPGCALSIEGPHGSLLAMPTWSPRVILARVKNWFRRLVA